MEIYHRLKVVGAPSVVKVPGVMLTGSHRLVALGRTIRKARRDRDLSQEALAARAGLNPKHLGEIERANKDPRATTVMRIAEALELRSGELFALVDERCES